MSKEGFPTVVVPEMPQETSQKSKQFTIVTAWASVATALFLVLLIGGAIYVTELKDQDDCQVTTNPTENSKAYEMTYEDDGHEEKEDVYLDGNTQTELILKKTEDGTIEAIAEIDYKKKIAAAYLPADDICVLLAGLDIDWLQTWEVEADPETHMVDVPSDVPIEDLDYQVTRNRVTDMSILPSHMTTFCQGKAIYWMQPIDEDSGGRQKRRDRVVIRPDDGVVKKIVCIYGSDGDLKRVRIVME